MYTIVGGDGQKYGPVSVDELRRWIVEGRANGQSQVQAEGGEWKALSTYPEFSDLLQGSAVPPPTVSAAAPEPWVSGAPRTNSMAIASLVLSILGLLCCGPIFSTIGLILGIVAIGQINKNPTLEGGKGLAIAAIAIAAVGYLMFAIFILSGAWQELLRSIQ